MKLICIKCPRGCELRVTKKSIEELINSLTKDMKEAAKNLDFEQAANLRDIILELKAEIAG